MQPTPAPAEPLSIDRREARTRDGWRLGLKRTVAPARLSRGARPVLLLPGYGMNSFIFGFHPRGTSMERSLAEAGLEVWSADLRGQGRSRPETAGAPGPALRAYAEQDVAAAIDEVLAATASTADRVSLVGCSLGGSIAYAHLALRPDHRVGALVAIGAPLRWTGAHPALRLAAAAPRLVGLLRLGGTRKLAGRALGLLRRFPGLLSLYMNAGHVDLGAASELVQTVEDPVPRVNRDIARWIGAGDLVLGGVSVCDALRRVELPLLVVVSNRDGIVPEAAALSALPAWGGRDATVLRVGDEQDWFAHADLFIAHDAPARVFEPIARWLRDREARAT